MKSISNEAIWLTVSTLPKLGSLLPEAVHLVIVLDGICQGQLLSQVVADLGLLPGRQWRAEIFASLTHNYKQQQQAECKLIPNTKIGIRHNSPHQYW